MTVSNRLNAFDAAEASRRCKDFRRRILEISQQVQALHISSAFSCTEIVDAIYFGLMRDGASGRSQDTFLMSKGHGCMIQYVILEHLGILSRRDLDLYCKADGILGCHPDYGNPGIEASTGSLGHGLSMAVGMAYAEKKKSNTIYVVLSDGEVQEGSTWEATMMASSLGISNLVAFMDNNDFQSLGRTTETHPSFYPVVEKYQAFGWEAVEVNGHDASAIVEAVLNRSGTRPLMVNCKTTKGKGVSYMENVPIWHYRSPNKEEYAIALAEIEKKRSMRNTFSETLYACAKEDPRISIVVADISPAGSMAKFRDEYPDRFINVGVAEQVMIGICAGLALKGQQPFAYTIATFALYRPFEMVRDDLCYQNLPVTVVGMGSGVVYSTLGGTHHTMEDVAIASALPNMQVICPCDPLEVIDAVKYCATQKNGPVYLKLGKAGEPRVTEKAADPFVIGKIRYLQKGSDVCILTYGPTVAKALQVAEGLAAAGKSASVVSVHTLKPIDREGITQALRSHKQVLVLEEHVPHGGLASRVKEIAWDIQAPCQLDAFTLQDAFIHCYGSHDDLLASHGITVERVLAKVLAAGQGAQLPR